ncbi:MAG: GntR family transcriptional regulator [Victivallales bacterium]|nr:GntR family transcriptional regulator [Victivallales bacterium]
MSNRSSSPSLGVQAELVRNHLLDYMRKHTLRPGDRLPTQKELRTELGVGNKTIQRAIDSLVTEGIAEGRGKTGFFLKDVLQGETTRRRRVGLVYTRLPKSPFYTALLFCLEMAFHDRNCELRNFMRKPMPLTLRNAFSYFPGLREAIERHETDLLFSMSRFPQDMLELCAKHHLPVCHFGSQPGYPNRIAIVPLFEQAMTVFAERGLKRPAIICSTSNQHQQSLPLLEKALRPFHGERWQDYSWCCGTDDFSMEYGPTLWARWQHVADRHLGLPAERRPDALFIPDDFIACYFMMALQVRGITPPPIICIRSQQIPIGFPGCLAGWFEIDIEQLADMAVELALAQMEPSAQPRTEPVFYTPPFIDTRVFHD